MVDGLKMIKIIGIRCSNISICSEEEIGFILDKKVGNVLLFVFWNIRKE